MTTQSHLLLDTPDPVKTRDVSLIEVYVWEIPVRVTHWLTALSLFVLAATGVYIGYPFLISSGAATDRFVMGTVKAVHSYAAIVFTLSVLSRIVWMFLGNRYARWDNFLPVAKKRFKALWPTLKFYTFFQRKPPGFIGHNPLAGAAYTVIFLLFLVEIGTGLALYGASAHVDSPLRIFGGLAPLFGGLQWARFIHHGIMWLLLGFTVHHVYSSLLMSQVEANATIESIFSGHKFVPREDLIYSGYRFEPREERKTEAEHETEKPGETREPAARSREEAP